MDTLTAPFPAPPGGGPGTASVPAGTGPPASIGLCAVWSRHAAELAVPLGAELQRWEETPSTDRMVADGYLVRLLSGRFIPPDLLGTAVSRALALGCALGGHLQAQHVIAGPSAAWVLCGGDPPRVAELLSPAHRGELAGVRQRHARLRADEVETIGGAPVTIPVRTATDLLRFTPTTVAAPALQALIGDGLVEVGQVLERLRGMHRHPGVETARERIGPLVGSLSPG